MKQVEKENAVQKHGEYLNLLHSMQREIKFDPPGTKPSLTSQLAKRIPWLNRFIRKTGESGEELVKLAGRVNRLDPFQNEDIGGAFSFGGFALNMLDFVRIPFIYLVAYLLGQKVPITLNNNARWFYAAVVAAIALAALLVPYAAPVLGIVGAVIGVGAAVIELGSTLYQRYQLGKELGRVKKLLEAEDQELALIKEKAAALENQLKTAVEEEHIRAIYLEIAVLHDDFEVHANQQELLRTKQVIAQRKMEALGIMGVVDNCVKVTWASLTLLAGVIALFFPPVGLGLLIGVSVFSATYFFVRLAGPHILSLGKSIANKITGSSSDEPENTGETNAPRPDAGQSNAPLEQANEQEQTVATWPVEIYGSKEDLSALEAGTTSHIKAKVRLELFAIEKGEAAKNPSLSAPARILGRLLIMEELAAQNEGPTSETGTETQEITVTEETQVPARQAPAPQAPAPQAPAPQAPAPQAPAPNSSEAEEPVQPIANTNKSL